ncbi:hypothetical protein PUMCH_002642 [Australozyma saopauloensis]|uniref:DUF676 domain-containing protein n=1 Tax=Australozyma saopauloensis TaxID=291208 RepID=A0AAX4H9T8_9ASCO|nr:hypothetical protein PUMCH_002642 [[Candida] saopauloensis]
MTADISWYKQKHVLKIGDVCRYTIRYTRTDPHISEIYLRVKNMEQTTLRAIHLLNGPFMLYCHVTPKNYNQKKPFVPQDSDSKKGNSEVTFRNQIKPGQTFNVRLYLNDNSLAETHEDGTTTHEWECDIISQIVLNRRASIRVVVMVGNDLEEMRRLNRSTLTSLSKGDFKLNHTQLWNSDWGTVLCKDLQVECKTTADLWPSVPLTPKDRPLHLVVVTHGLFSNLTADMLYLRDSLYGIKSDGAADNEAIFVAGCKDNAGKTEKGVHRLGVNVAASVIDTIDDLTTSGYTVSSISFVGHSLGGPVQVYALKNILQVKGALYFKDQNIKLKHLVLLACPMLGVLSEMSLIILWFLDLGTLGKTGRDLTLLKKLPSITNGLSLFHALRPILETLPDDPIQSCLKQFELLTLYANAINDGIVPLRTSALLYLDWEGLGEVRQVKSHHGLSDQESINPETFQSEHSNENPASSNTYEPLVGSNDAGPGVAEISEETNSNFSDKYATFLARIFSLDAESASSAKKKKRLSRLKKYSKISAKSSDTRLSEKAEEEEANAQNENEDGADNEEFDTLHIPPKASAVESAINSLICPIPSRRYVLEPKSRSQVIFHDKFYHHDSLPEQEPKRVAGVSKFFKYRDWRVDKQVRIARKYHAPDVAWRKVLVCLPPDAHNNIVVRRRFANGYGWGVIEHLTENVFEKKLQAKF